VNKLLLSLLVSILAIGLTACGGGGGGGGGGDPVPTPTVAVTVPLLAAVQNSVGSSHAYNFNVSGFWNTANNTLTGAGSRTDSAGVSAIVGGVTYIKVTGTTTGTATAVDSTSLNLNQSGVEYLNPTTFATVIVDDTNPYAVYSTYTYPATVSVGDTGQYATATLYSSSAKTTVVGSATLTYQVLANNSTSVLLKVITNVYNTSSQQTLQSITTSTISTAGISTLVSVEQYRYSASGSTPYYIKYAQ